MIRRFVNLNTDKDVRESPVGSYVLFTDYMKMERAFRQLHLVVEAEFGDGRTTRARGDAEVEKVLTGEYDKTTFTCSGEPMDFYGYYDEQK